MDELKYYDRIEAYHEKRLSAKDNLQFEQDLLTNEELKLEYDAYLMTLEASYVLGYEQLKSRKSSAETDGTAVVRTMNARRWLAAASIVAVIGFSMIWANQLYTNEALALNAFTETNVSATRTTNESSQLKQIKDAFELKDYKRVVDLVQAVNVTNSIYSEVQFIASHASIQIDNYENAIPGFIVAATDKEFIHASNAQWNLALCYVMTDQHDKALNILNIISSDPTEDYYEKAVELRGKLGSFWRKLII